MRIASQFFVFWLVQRKVLVLPDRVQIFTSRKVLQFFRCRKSFSDCRFFLRVHASEECKSGLVSTFMAAISGCSSKSPIPVISESSSPVQCENVALFDDAKVAHRKFEKEVPKKSFISTTISEFDS
eukprot:GHVP01063707.1.p1 GENE.GHVP01063707.1~~GHVP01063707.1.p1  ORF type:complete len:126 (+),score=11.45 GHVP01063707.1:368-745(+)